MVSRDGGKGGILKASRKADGTKAANHHFKGFGEPGVKNLKAQKSSSY